jgi:hypothetical protein
VAVLCVLITEGGDKYVVGVKHPRCPAGSAAHLEIPIGQ